MDPATDQQGQTQPVTPQAATPPHPPDMEAAPAPIKPDGGVLGHAAIGMLAGATQSHVQQNAPPDMEAAPAHMEVAGTPAAPTWWDKTKLALVESNPVFKTIQNVHEWAGTAADWYKQQAANREQANLVAAAKGQQSPYSDIATMGLRDIGGVAQQVSETATPAGVAMTAATMNPVTAGVLGVGFLAHGLYNVGKGLYNMTQDWSDLAWENPELVEQVLSGAAEAVGGAAGAKSGLDSLSHAYKNISSHTTDERFEQFQNAAPSTKSTPYTRLTWEMANPFLESENKTGIAPLEGPDAIRNGVELATNAIEKMEDKIAKVIDATPNEPVIFKDATGKEFPIDPITDAATELRGSVRKDFLDAGLKELEKYPLNPQVDGPITLRQADDIRKQLNADNDATLATLQAKGPHAVERAMQTDPAFAARQAASESLRSGIYTTLEKLGLPDAAKMRLDEGALIKVRKALQNQVENAGKTVRTAKKPSTLRQVAKRTLTATGAAAGLTIGAKVGHPVAGAAVGAATGEKIAEAMTPEKLTRAEWLERAYQPIKPKISPVQATPGAGIPGVIAHQLPAGYIHVRGSDGSEHYIPEAQLQNAYQVDPHLTIVSQ